MTPRLVAHATVICRLSSRREKKTSIFFTVDTCLWFVFTAVAVITGTMCRDTRVCAGASPGCVGVHHRDARPRRSARRHGWPHGTRRYAPSSRLPVAGIYVLMAAVCARTRVPIAILSGVVHITPAKVLLSFSRVCSRPSRREGEYWSYSRRPAWRATISRMNSAAPRSTLDLGSALGAGDAGREEAQNCS